MSKQLKQLPKFKNEDQERKFWATHDSTGYINWSEAKLQTKNSPRLKRSNKTKTS